MTHTILLSIVNRSVSSLLEAMLDANGIFTEKGKQFAKLIKDEYSLSEMDKLEFYLFENNIEYKRIVKENDPCYGNFDQIRCGKWDAVCHNGSYGHEEGLLETMGMSEDNGDVTGWQTAEDIIARLKKEETA